MADDDTPRWIMPPPMVADDRVRRAVDAVRSWHRVSFDREPSRIEETMYTEVARRALAADDAFLAARVKPRATPDQLRVMLAKLRAELDYQKAQRKADKTRLRLRAEALNTREKTINERGARMDQLERDAAAWQRTAEEMTGQCNILRDQLREHGIAPDRRCE